MPEHNGAGDDRGGPLLAVKGVSVRFGGIKALDEISIDVDRGAICGLIGPNGAGKTTLFNCLSRLYTPTKGEITFAGVSLLPLAPHDMAHIGIGRTFQNLAMFNSMTVADNVLMGRQVKSRTGYFENIFRTPSVAREERDNRARTNEMLAFLDLSAIASRSVADLPFGTRKRVELARALASEPKLLLLDEPAAGLNHEEVEQLMSLIQRVNRELNVTVLLVEHHLNLVMRVSHKVVALDFGRKIAEGSPAFVQNDREVIRAYLGAAET